MVVMVDVAMATDVFRATAYITGVSRPTLYSRPISGLSEAEGI